MARGQLVGTGSKLAKMAQSGSLTPLPLTRASCFVNNDCITAEMTYSTTHVHHKALAWSQATVYGTPV